jgi:hypothetical protein
MNKNLTTQIINHIFYSFGVVPNNVIDFNTFNSIKSKQYLLDEKLSFLNDQEQEIKNNIWGLQLSVENKNFRVLIADCTTDSDVLQYTGIFHLEENPIYGISVLYSSGFNPCPLIAVSLEGKNWMPCNTYLQATFLAGMENIKEIKFNWNKCVNYQQEHQALLSFIKFYDKFYEDVSEGQENKF